MTWFLVLLFSAILESLWAVSVVAVEKRSIFWVVLLSMVMPLIGYVNNIVIVSDHSYLVPVDIGHGIGGLGGMLLIIYVWSGRSGPRDL